MANAHHGGLPPAGPFDPREDLLNALDSIQTPGSFATIGRLLDAPPAGLFVDGVGEVSMPLSGAQAAQLIEKCRRAPFGRKEETLVDLSVRKCWEMDHSQFSFRDPAWPSYLTTICANVLMIWALTPSSMLRFTRCSFTGREPCSRPIPSWSSRPRSDDRSRLTNQHREMPRHVWHPRGVSAVGTSGR